MPSLTKLIKNKAFKNLRKWFIYHFPSPGMSTGELDIIGTEGETSNYGGDIGTAFDYLFRFKMEQLKPIEGDSSPESWLAYRVYLQLPKKFMEIAESKMDIAVKTYEAFVKNDEVSDDLFESCLFLNQLDIIARSGQLIIEGFGDINTQKRDELRRIYENVSWEAFDEESCVLNPVFGSNELNVGADGDVIIGNTLIELKCSKTVKLERRHLNQLIGYCMLNLLKPKKEQYDIDTIGIYFARADYLWLMKLEDFYSKKELQKRAKEFEKLITNPNLDLLPEKPEKRSVTNSLEQNETLERIKKLFDKQ